MTFPSIPLDVTTELYYSGSWHDITSDVRHDEGITIQRGRSDEQPSASPSTCTFKLANNSPHPYSPELPTSSLYGLIGRNTRVRTRIGASDVALTLAGGSDPFPGGWVETPDAAALDITGDIDIRLDLEPAQWRWFPVNVTSTHFVTLAGKHESDGDQRSWVCAVRHDGYLRFRIFTAGTTGSAISYLSTEPVPVDSGRLAIRVTLDVDNGAAGHDVRFWTAPTISGTWTQLGATITTAGTTSIFSSSAPVTVGAVADGEGYAPGTTTYTGLVRAFELYDGIAGTLVADPDFTGQDTFTTAFTDSLGLQWTLHRTAEFVNDSARHCGEVPDWSSQWDSTGNDVWVPVSASGILRRLRQGDRPIASPMRNAYTLHSFEDIELAAYWPCEDEESATQIASGIGGPPMTVGLIEGFPTRDIGFAGYSGFVASQPITTFGVTTAHGVVPAADPTGRIHLSFLMHVPSTGLSSTLPVINIATTGTAAEWALECNSGGSLRMVATASDGTNLLTSGFIAFDVNDKDLYVQLDFVQNGSDVDWTIIAGEQGASGLSGFGSFSDTLAGETIGAPTKVFLSKIGDLEGTALGHVAVRTQFSKFIFGNVTPEALAGHDGEKAGYRLIRTCAENEVPILFVGDPENTPRCGVQPIDSFVDVLEDAAAVDGGILAEARSLVGVEYRTQANLYNQDTQVALDYTDLTKTPAPKGDDRYIRNDVTVQRRGGSARRATQTSGPLNTSSPLDDPQGVGVYDERVTLGLYSDGQLDDQAGWRLHLGTVDESRYPALQVKLQRSTSLSTSVLGLDLGDRVTIANMPSWLRPDTASQIARGYREYLESFRHEVEYACTAETPYHVGIVGTSKLDSTDTYTAGPLTTTGTDVYTWVKAGPLWTTTPGQFPFDLSAGGERWTATACADAIEDAFGRTVSNGWGSADSGQAWTTTGGSASDFAVSGTTGDITLTSVSVARWALLGVDLADIDVSAVVSSSVIATGDWITTALVARYTDASNYLAAQVEFKDTGNVGIALYVVASGAASFLAGSEIGTYLAGFPFGVRLQVEGDTARAKLWVGTEPTAWTIEGTGADALAAGDAGVRAELAAGNTNTNPVVSWDDLTAPRMQLFTVTRSGNGIVKTHDAATQIRLWDRTVIGMGV